MKKEKVNNNDESKLRNFGKRNLKKILIVGSILCILIAGIIILLINNKPEKESLVLEQFDPIVARLEDNSIYITGAKPDISFEVEKEDGFTFKVLDEDNKKVEAILDNNVIKAPANSYQEGKTYTLEINKGKFVNEEYKDSNKITFSIVRKSKQTSKIKEDLTKVNADDIKINDNILTSNKKYDLNEVIIVHDNDKPVSAYKIAKINKDNTYEVEAPRIDELFSEIDYYGVELLDFSKWENAEEIKEYLALEVENSIIDLLVDTVYAKSTVKIKNPTFIKGGIKVGIEIEADPDNSYLFSKKFLKNHEAKIELEAELTFDFFKDIKKEDYDLALTTNLKLTPKFKLTHRNKSLQNLRDYIKDETSKTGEYFTYWLNKDFKSLAKDTIKISTPIGSANIPTNVPFLNIKISTGVLFDIDAKVDLEANMMADTTVKIGVSSKKGLYGDIKVDGSAEASLTGETETKLGLTSSAGLNFLDIIELKGTYESGMYADGKVKITDKNKNQKETITLDVTWDIGSFRSIKAEARAFNLKLSKDFTKDNDKAPFKSYGKRFEIVKKSSNTEDKPVNKEETPKPEENKPTDNNNNKPTFRYTKEEVKEKIEKSYKKIIIDNFYAGYNGSTDTVGYFYIYKTLNFANNILSYKWEFHDKDNSIVNTYTCDYNYLNNNMTCNNYSNAKSYLTKECQFDFNDPLIQQYYDPSDVDKCIDRYIQSEQKIKEKISNEFNKVLTNAELTKEDLGVLK